jgi:hypothetical protein
VPGAERATVNLAHVVAAVEFAPERGGATRGEADQAGVAAAVEQLRQVAEDAAGGRGPPGPSGP